MIIALDYDGTYTADPDLWLAFIAHAKKRGHQVICVTMRSPEEAASMDVRVQIETEIHCTNRKAKKPFMRTKGIDPNIWIDDNPDWLFEDAT